MNELKNKMLKEAKSLHKKALQTSLTIVGSNTLLAAKSFCNLGRLYQTLGKYEVIFVLFVENLRPLYTFI